MQRETKELQKKMKTAAYEEGYKAFLSGIKGYDNPYEFGSKSWENWIDGFFDAREGF